MIVGEQLNWRNGNCFCRTCFLPTTKPTSFVETVLYHHFMKSLFKFVHWFWGILIFLHKRYELRLTPPPPLKPVCNFSLSHEIPIFLKQLLSFAEKDDVPVICIVKQLHEAFLKSIRQIGSNCVHCVCRAHLAGQSSILQAYYPKIVSSCGSQNYKETLKYKNMSLQKYKTHLASELSILRLRRLSTDSQQLQSLCFTPTGLHLHLLFSSLFAL